MNAFEFGRMVKQALPLSLLGGQDQYGRTMPAEDPRSAAPVAAPAQRPAAAPLPSGSVNYNHPQQKAFQSFYNSTVNGRGAHVPPPLTSTRSQGHVPYPIRGAGRMGAIPALSPADASAGVRASK